VGVTFLEYISIEEIIFLRFIAEINRLNFSVSGGAEII
jgi:hypothetical protein